MSDYLAALLLGISFSNLWLCVLLVFSLQTTGRATCGGYLLGRALAICALAASAALLGALVPVDRSVINLISGLLLCGFAIYLAATRLGSWRPPWRGRAATGDHQGSPGCDGNCDGCPTRTHEAYASACHSCDDKGLCAAEEPEVEPLTRDARRVWRRRVREPQGRGFLFGVGMGAMRGAATCGKLAVLLPVLVQAPVAKAVGVGALFCLSSSVYPLLGVFLGEIALRLVRFKRVIFIAGCLLLALAGVHYLHAGLTGWH
jgi:hypothetical protein